MNPTLLKVNVACKCAYQFYRKDQRTFAGSNFDWTLPQSACKPIFQAEWSGESMTAWTWNTIKHNPPTSGCTNILTIIEIIELSFAGQIRNHLWSNHYMSEKSPFYRTIYLKFWISTYLSWMSECKHMQGMKQNFNETDLRSDCCTIGLWNCPLH